MGVVRGDPGDSSAKETKREPGEGVTCFFSRCPMLFTALRLHMLLPLPRIRFKPPFKPSLHLILLEAFLSCPEVGNDPITFCLYFFLQVPSYLAVMYQLLSFSVDDGELFYGNQ